MPHWDYSCPTCGITVDSTFTVQHCPRCGAQMTRLPAAPSFVLKGAGFHANDYPKKGAT
jgi:putative FmdB family regulatory protein